MRYVVTLFLLLLPTASTLADDSETNPVAKKIKSTLQKKVDKQFDQYDGYCDLKGDVVVEAGLLSKANGGYLILPANLILANPGY
ncbi:hypothetical protein HYN85_24025, partial [Vibrio parahaemolyticus]|nr:hypothetical protein [Vibrio parahaemolyticus]MCF9434244.1 hypothetical protein [Vibrio parahaemolyticus]